MKTSGTLKKWNVENKLDRDGNPDPRITVTVEIPFQVHLATSLAQITTGDVLSFGLEKYQMDMDFPGKEPDLEETDCQEEEQQQLLLTEGGIEDAETEEIEEESQEDETDEQPLEEATG